MQIHAMNVTFTRGIGAKAGKESELGDSPKNRKGLVSPSLVVNLIYETNQLSLVIIRPNQQ